MGYVEIEINVVCQKCDSALDAHICISSDGQQEIAAEFCPVCAEAEHDNGYEEGYEAGVEEGRRQIEDE